jgi:hypothetical protein
MSKNFQGAKKMKKVFSLFFVVLMLSAAGCDDSSSNDSDFLIPTSEQLNLNEPVQNIAIAASGAISYKFSVPTVDTYTISLTGLTTEVDVKVLTYPNIYDVDVVQNIAENQVRGSESVINIELSPWAYVILITEVGGSAGTFNLEVSN